MENTQSIGAKIVALRKEKGCTQADLGAYLNISYQAVSKWERGESYPDFVTMAKIAQFFGVSLEYFAEENSETAQTAVAETEETAEKNVSEQKMLGVCTTCGRTVYDGEEWSTEPVLLCQKCHDRKVLLAKQEEERKRAEEKKKREEAQRQAVMHLAKMTRKRNIGFWVGGFAGGALLTIFLVCAISGAIASMGTGIILAVLFGALGFTFISQLIWNGAVRACAGYGGAIIGTPGVIFSLDLDGIIFLIGAKILFAVLRWLVWVATSLCTIVAAVVISPFTFVPALLRMNEGRDVED